MLRDARNPAKAAHLLEAPRNTARRILAFCVLMLMLPVVSASPLPGVAEQLEMSPGMASCPCADPDLCQPISTVHQWEVFGFAVSRNATYDRYDWTQLTTAAWNDDPVLMCTAHAAGARVVLDGRGANPAEVFGNRTARAEWLAGQVQKALDSHLDGINFDMESPLPMGDPLAFEYSALVAEAAEAFHKAIPGSQVSVDIPWSPHGIDGRNFDWAGLAKAADLLVVMAYDTQSQIWGRCVASANSPLALVKRGLQQWLDLGMPRSKLVLGVPWYGYRYNCINQAFVAGEDDLCELHPVSFQGCPCSDAAGEEVCYSQIRQEIRRGSAGSEAAAVATASGGPVVEAWAAGDAQRALHGVMGETGDAPALFACEEPKEDTTQGSLYTRCHTSAEPQKHRYQMWFDDPKSMSRLYALAAELGLRGAGIWNLDCLDYACSDPACRGDTDAMWAALRTFTGWQPGTVHQSIAS